MELKGMPYLQRKLTNKRTRVCCRYDYYEMKNLTRDLGISTPPNQMYLQSVLGWCAKSVDSLGDRLNVRAIENENFDLAQIFQANNPDVFFTSAINSALIASCSFVYISADEKGFPRLQVVDGSNATGIINPITGLLNEGYAVLERDPDSKTPILEAYFEPGKTTYYAKGHIPYSVETNVNIPLLVPIVYKPDAKRPFGHSRISRTCMSIQDAAARTIKRSEIAAEFYSFPQKYATGMDPDAEPFDKWRATMSAMMVFTKDEDGDHPVIGQFAQQSMEPHTTQLKMFAALFAGETGLTLDDLGFATGNPSSSDAIKAAHENLRLTARKAQKYFGTGFKNVAMVAASLRDNFNYDRKAFLDTEVLWEPVFEPDGSSLSGMGDAIIKLSQAVPDYITKDKIDTLTGLHD